MHLVRTKTRWPAWPRWAVSVVLLWLALVALGAWLNHAVGEHAGPLCLFRRLTGHPCPTCGTTRLVLAMLRGDWLHALAANPLMFALLSVGALLLGLHVGLKRRVALPPAWRRERLWVGLLGVAMLADWIYLWHCL